MNKLLSAFRRSHRPDIDGLSAFLDGRLPPSRAAACEAHLASCAACGARVEELRRMRSALAALPQAEAPRSFRLQRSQVEAPPNPLRRAPGFVYAVPALGFAAAVALVVLVGVDLSGGSRANQASPAERNFAFSQGAPVQSAEVTRSAAASTAQSIAGAGAAAAAPALPTPPSAELQDSANPPSPAAGGPATTPTTPADASAFKAARPAPSPTAGTANEAPSAPPTAAAAAASKQQGGSNGGGTDWIRIGEIIAACVATGALAATAGMWKLRRKPS